ncbi:Rrf2 family transcriptional regulator [Nostoc sp. FACHB-892]|uniref:RrF2 family transcriptional regulator n=1 Tax=Nostoc sp. FACHB-892 TaxID=2692843 RepID=UPI0016864B5B|nr:Rrf2 family transcriptional regulator [Nostoc sp. FACHB-892]MBD2730861.1 Rrf2 family transcriptional regulator [Nostoc sp. FACHB-892]
MKLSNSFEYSLLAMLALVDCYQNGDSMQIKEIAELRSIPNRYLEQLLATLRCRGLINSIRGSKGGYVLARDPRKITVLDVLTSIEGVEIDASTNNTTLGNIESCVVEEVWQEACQAANLVLQKYSLQDLWEKQATRPQRALMYYI